MTAPNNNNLALQIAATTMQVICKADPNGQMDNADVLSMLQELADRTVSADASAAAGIVRAYAGPFADAPDALPVGTDDSDEELNFGNESIESCPCEDCA